MATTFPVKALTALLLVLALFVCVFALASCGDSEESSSTAPASSEASSAESSSEETSSEEPSSEETSSEEASSDTFVGTYTSTEGDGEILTLEEDGTFTSVVVTELDIRNSDGEYAKSTETTVGTYTIEDGVCTLQASDLVLKVEGLEGEEEIIAENAELMAEGDEDALAMYTRLLSGETLTGNDLYGEEFSALLSVFTVDVTLDTESMSFSYELGF